MYILFNFLYIQIFWLPKKKKKTPASGWETALQGWPILREQGFSLGQAFRIKPPNPEPYLFCLTYTPQETIFLCLHHPRVRFQATRYPSSRLEPCVIFQTSQSCAVHAQLCLILCDSMDCSLPGSPVYWISQAGILGCHLLLQGIFSTQGLNLCLLHWRWIPYHCATWEAPDAAYHALSCLSVETQQRLWPQLLPVPVFCLLTTLVFNHVALRGRPCLLSLGLMSIINLIFLILSSISYFDSPWLTISLKKKRKIKHKFPTYVCNFNAALLTHTLLSSYTEPLAIP